MTHSIKLLLGGDVMLGRLVKEAIQFHGIDYPLGKLYSLFHETDLCIVNLECAITNHSSRWSGEPKAFYFGAPPEAADILQRCGIHLVSLANNHILDFDTTGLFDTLHFLKEKKIAFAGAGENEKSALEPTTLEIKNTRFGFTAFCDHQSDFAARKNTPGMAYLDLENEEAASLEKIKFNLEKMQKQQVDYPILSLHWGPNQANRPSAQFVRIAHAAIDMGYKLLFGHSAHVFQGIEIYQGCPILYAAGDLVDDYYVDPDFRNDHQLVFEIEIENLKLKYIKLHPVFIENCQTQPANTHQFYHIAERAKKLCAEMGTFLKEENQQLIMRCI